MYSNNIVNFQESTIILNAHTKMSGKLSYATRNFGQMATTVLSYYSLSIFFLFSNTVSYDHCLDQCTQLLKGFFFKD